MYMYVADELHLEYTFYNMCLDIKTTVTVLHDLLKANINGATSRWQLAAAKSLVQFQQQLLTCNRQ